MLKDVDIIDHTLRITQRLIVRKRYKLVWSIRSTPSSMNSNMVSARGISDTTIIYNIIINDTQKRPPSMNILTTAIRLKNIFSSTVMLKRKKLLELFWRKVTIRFLTLDPYSLALIFFNFYPLQILIQCCFIQIENP